MLNPRRQKPHAYHSSLHLLKSRIGSGQMIEIGSVRWALLLAKMHRTPGRLRAWMKVRLLNRISRLGE